MSGGGGFQYQARRVADPKPVVRGNLNPDPYAAGVSGNTDQTNYSALRLIIQLTLFIIIN